MVPFSGAADSFRQIRRVGRDPGRDDALLHILQIGKTKMLRRRYIAQERSAVSRRDRSADGRRNMVISRRHVRYQRPQHIEGSALADFLLDPHIGLDLI